MKINLPCKTIFKSLLFNFVVLFFIANLVSAQNKEQYSVQIKSSENYLLISKMVDDFIQSGIPAYSVKSDISEKIYHRLRIGPFPSSDDAKKFAEYQPYEDYWVVNTADEPNTRKTKIENIIYSEFSSVSTSLYIYTGQRHPILIIYQKKFGIEASILPSDLFLYLKDRDSAIHLKNVTGFREMDDSVQYGKSVEVYFDPEGKPVENYLNQVSQISKQTGISSDIIRKELSFFNDGYDAHLTVLKAYDLTKRKIMSFPKIGFDFSSENKVEKWRGKIDRQKPMGNHLMKKINSEEMQIFRGNQLLIISKELPSSPDKMWLCIIFYQN